MQLPAPRSRAVAWVKDGPVGVEFTEIEIGAEQLTARGVAIGSALLPYRLDYELETAAEFVTSHLHATSRGQGWRRELDLRRDERGAWVIAADEEDEVDLPPPGGDAASLAAGRDCDLGLSPLTNTMPILRHGLLDGGGPIELTMAWVAVPALSVQADRQRYRHVSSASDHSVVRYEAVDGSFAADIVLDTDGVVIDYPGIGRRLGETTPFSY
jgi:uncharacterized protein